MGGSSDADQTRQATGPVLRIYRDPLLRWFLAPWFVLVPIVLVGGAVDASSKANWWVAGPAGAATIGMLVVITIFLRKVAVYETRDGLLGRGGLPRYRSRVAWRDAVAFTYGFSFASGARRIVVVECADGTRKVLYGSARRMTWDGGSTADFAALLAERTQFVGDAKTST